MMSRIVLLMLIIVLAGTGVSIAIVYGHTGECNPDMQIWEKHFQLLCWVVEIHEQNELIIDKLDWNNCAISHKDTHGYTYKHGSFMSPIDDNANNYEQLIYLCGEMP